MIADIGATYQGGSGARSQKSPAAYAAIASGVQDVAVVGCEVEAVGPVVDIREVRHGSRSDRTFDEESPDFDGYESWLEDGYVDPPFLYCDAGTELWRRMAAAGELHGPDAAPPRRAPLIEVVREVAVAAEQEQDHELIGMWYAFGCDTLLRGPAGCPFDVTELAEMPAVQDLRAVVRRTDALPIAQRSPYAVPVEFADHHDLEAWWWQL
ncbi:hypothetical protein ACWCQQ_49235 [Streptomyces sp. NPDC002143]